MIDMAAAYDLLQAMIKEHQSDALKFSIVRNDIPPKRGIAVGVQGNAGAASFCLWETGECDVDVLLGGKFVENEWGQIVSEDTLSKVFEQFLSRVGRLNSSGK